VVQLVTPHKKGTFFLQWMFVVPQAKIFMPRKSCVSSQKKWTTNSERKTGGKVWEIIQGRGCSGGKVSAIKTPNPLFRAFLLQQLQSYKNFRHFFQTAKNAMHWIFLTFHRRRRRRDHLQRHETRGQDKPEIASVRLPMSTHRVENHSFLYPRFDIIGEAKTVSSSVCTT
jgi:hypothetical protein